MKEKMRPLYAVVFLCMLLGFDAAAANRFGVAFVHGTGSYSHNTARDFWTWENIESMKSALPNVNYYDIIHCDFDQYMWHINAGGCLARQVGAFQRRHNLDHIMLVTHSNGGNVARWVLSNRDYSDDYYPNFSKVRYMVNIAPTSKGTPLATAVRNGHSFEQTLGWLLGYDSPAVDQQQTHRMRYYNEQYLRGTDGRPALSTFTYNISGSDVDASLVDYEWILFPLIGYPVPDSSPLCGGYNLNLGLSITRAWLDNCSDGFVNCSSQEAVGYAHRDYTFTDRDEPLSHNQSRRKCFGVDRRVKAFIRDFVAWFDF